MNEDVEQIEAEVAATEEQAEIQPLAELRLIRGGAMTDELFPLGEQNLIGRFDPAIGHVDVDLGPLPESSVVSRKHAEIWRDSDRWLLRDLGSSNGTFVSESGDFRRLDTDTEQELADGQEISLGNVRFSFHINVEPVVVPTEDPTA
jgi:hypothetical protein